ncbi:MAG: hypothetical protein ACREQN_04325 [Candidatus Binataceae bacterium]
MNNRIYDPLAYSKYKTDIYDRPRNSHFFFWCFLLFTYVILVIPAVIWLFHKPKVKPEYIPPTLNPLGTVFLWA